MSAVLRHVASAAMLIIYLALATPLAPLSTAFVAWLDGDHEVALTSEKNQMTVVLRHDASNARTALNHTHCVVASALTLLSESCGPEHSDHLIRFQTSASSTLRQALARSSLVAPSQDVTTSPSSLPPWTAPAHPEPQPALDPTHRPALAVSVAQSTVLLI